MRSVGRNTRRNFERGAIMQEKMTKIFELLAKVDDALFEQFFDIDSDKMLDEKIEVLTALADGKKPSEIENYYKVLELYPQDGEIWD